MLEFDFSGKNYIVTGGAGSIGRAVAETVVGCGGRVCAVDIDENTLREMSGELPAELFTYRRVDLSSPADIRKNFGSDPQKLDKYLNQAAERACCL
jgi:NAD(P)-dependent dehydrogenase (short-subunit alcohol dehydrogenase family)